MLTTVSYRWLVLVLALVASEAVTDDIDIYFDSRAGGTPYVLLVLDLREGLFETFCRFEDCAPPRLSRSAYARLEEWGGFAPDEPVSRFEVLRAVLASVFDNPAYDDLHLAIMAAGPGDGGIVLKAYTALESRRDELAAVLAAIPGNPPGDGAHTFGARELLYEWYRYLRGGSLVFGDHAQSENGSFSLSPDPAAVSGGRYIAPEFGTKTSSPDCPRLLSLVVSMEALSPADDGAADGLIAADSGFPAGGFDSGGEMFRYMHAPKTDLLPQISGVQPLENSWVITAGGAAGLAGAGRRGATLDLDNPAALEAELRDLFQGVISASSTAVAASVPVNRNNRAEARGEIYLALFEARARVRWPGNLKKLKLADSGEPGRLVDVRGRPAVENEGEDRGRIAAGALTFWTDPASLPAPADGASGPGPGAGDGRDVTQGGAGQRLPGTGAVGDVNSGTSRRLFIEPPDLVNGSGQALLPFDVADATLTAAPYLPPALGAGDREQALDMIRWARGQDVDDEDGDGDTAEARAWLMGAVLHSRPLALNYGATPGYSDSNPNIRLFFGTTGGILHAIENTDTRGGESGREVYGFLPRGTLAAVPQRRANTATAQRMHYGVDGAPVALTRDRNGDGSLVSGQGDEAYVYFGLRRGGASYYALDVSDPAAPPLLQWKITRTNGGDFDHLGLTFSEPVVGKVRFSDTPTDVVIFAGGYHGGWNEDGSARVGKDAGADDDPVGNAVYIVDARSGALVWKAVPGNTGASDNRHFAHAGLLDSIPSRVSVLRDSAGIIHRLYVGDTGGTVWRVDTPPGNGTEHRAGNWFVSRFAELGDSGPAGDRRFFHAPALVETRDGNGEPYDGVLITSGNRAAPRDLSVDDRAFYLRDYAVESGDTLVRARSPLIPGDLAERGSCPGPTTVCGEARPLGWQRGFDQSGEKGLARPVVDGGRAYITTYVPPRETGTCTPSEGRSRLYQLNLADGGAASGNALFHDLGPGMAAGVVAAGSQLILPGAGAPGNTGSESGSGTDSGTDSGTEKVRDAAGARLIRIYWREPGIDKL